MQDPFNLELDDLVYEYPDITNPDFQTLISAKEEFRELSTQITEPIPKRGDFFKHQQLVHRYILMYDRLLITHRTGTGKTCALGGASEMFKRSMIHAAADFINLYMKPHRTHIKKVYILVRNKTLELQFRQEIACKCSQPGDYMTPSVLQASSVSAMRSAVTREMSSFYKITSYGDFAKKIWSGYFTDENLRRKYSGSLFIIDEVHNFRIDPTKENEDKDLRKHYNALHRLFHVIDRSKIIMASATPMTNVAGEIAPIMNLILPLDQQMPIPSKHKTITGPDIDVLGSTSVQKFGTYDYTNPTLEFLEPYFRGRVSYVREAEIDTIVEYKGHKINAEYNIGGGQYKSQQILYAIPMASPQQTLLIGPDGLPFLGQNYYYKQARDRRQDVVRTRERQAANMVYPNGKYGSKGFSKYVVKSEGTDKKYSAGPELQPWLRNLAYIRMLSSKFAEIIRITNENPDKSVFCYLPYVKGSGAIDLALCFEGMGYEIFDYRNPVFASSDPGELSYCPPSRIENPDMLNPDRPARIQRKNRVALFVGEGSDSLNANILETFNSPENRHGDFIKVLIVSPLGREGINTANVQTIHIVSPEWTQTAIYQAISRVLRATSHVDLLKEKRLKDPENASVSVDIYQHAAVMEDGSSIDVNMYQHVEMKDIEIKRIERIMKQSAIDCQLHRGRNIRSTDIAGSAICDYDVCDYKCARPDPLTVDYDSYDVLYSGATVDIIVDEIKSIYKSEFDLPLSALYQRLSKYKNKFIDMAIEQIITTKTRINDRFGYTSYLREDNGIIFLQRDYPLVDAHNSQNDYSLATYSQNLIAIDSVPLNKYQPEIGVIVQSELLDQIQRLVLPRDRMMLEGLLDRINTDTLIALVEELILSNSRGEGNQLLFREIMAIYYYYTEYINEPTETIDRTKAELTKVRGGGRRVGETKVADVIVEITDDDISENPFVYYHTLNSRKSGGTSYTETVDIFRVRGTIRVYKPSEGSGKWRDAEPHEQLVYTKLAQNRFIAKRDEYEQNPAVSVYGIILRTDNELRLVDMVSFREKLQDPTFELSEKTRPRGKKCTTRKMHELINILYHLKLMPFVTSQYR